MATSLASDTITKRRISWAELYRQRPDLRPANDNRPIPNFADENICAGRRSQADAA